LMRENNMNMNLFEVFFVLRYIYIFNRLPVVPNINRGIGIERFKEEAREFRLMIV
jgi:hypothetical protein